MTNQEQYNSISYNQEKATIGRKEAERLWELMKEYSDKQFDAMFLDDGEEEVEQYGQLMKEAHEDYKIVLSGVQFHEKRVRELIQIKKYRAPGEPIPTEVLEAMYIAYNELGYDGECEAIESELESRYERENNI